MQEDDFCMEGYRTLAIAIIEQAVKDYRCALRKLRRKPDNGVALHTVMECERFFRRDMGTYSDLDGEAIIREIRKKVQMEKKRR